MCNCEDLRLTFGVAGAPAMCAACVVAARHRELWDDGYVKIAVQYIQSFRDCGVPVATILSDHTAWTPCWAEQLRALLTGTWSLNPILTRAACDEEFCDAIMTVKLIAETAVSARRRSTDEPPPAAHEVAEKVESFARGHGVEIPPPPPPI